MGRLDNLTCLVTGAAGGIGSAIAQRLSAEGAKVVLCDLDQSRLETAVAKLDGESLMMTADATDEPRMVEVAEQAIAHFGSLDVVFNNAGISMFTPIETITRNDFDRLMGVNVYGVIVGSKVAAAVMRSQGRGGKIINTCSITGKRAAPRGALYGASKFAVRGITQSFAQELAADGITVNAFCPGIVDTPLWGPMATAYVEHGLLEDPADVLKMWNARTALGRIATPQDTTGLAIFLASAESDYITGQCINVDGGIVFD